MPDNNYLQYHSLLDRSPNLPTYYCTPTYDLFHPPPGTWAVCFQNRPGQMLSAHHPRASAHPHMTRHHHQEGPYSGPSTPVHETCQILGSLCLSQLSNRIVTRPHGHHSKLSSSTLCHAACFPAVIPSLPLHPSNYQLSTCPDPICSGLTCICINE